ncbi:MAG TPA: hypothetical protein DD979_17690 [Gammaproteobacteria bacterium]|jgi:hypothetical protein|nr:hypothetical protein [Gammaproteobacteria bacterium]
MKRLIPSLILLTATAPALGANAFNPNLSLVLDGSYQNSDAALGGGSEGFSLGHTELTMDANVDDQFYGRLTAVLEDHGVETEIGLEEAFVETTGLPSGLQLKLGRFLSGIGYLNGRHTHEDDFAMRPAVYRALLGSHYFDDGVQLQWLLPTNIYWLWRIEGLNGKRMLGSTHDRGLGVATISTKLGGDINASHSWQAGFSYVYNRLTNVGQDDAHEHDHEEEEHDHDHDDHDDHGHSHAVSYPGKHLYIVDGVWKWAPNGNARAKALKLSAEYLLARDPNRYATSDDTQEGWYAAASYKFAPAWQIAVRTGAVDLSEPHGDHFHAQQLTESDVSLTWSRSHFSKLRLMFSHQDSDDFDAEESLIKIQYQMVLGAHGAHAY